MNYTGFERDIHRQNCTSKSTWSNHNWCEKQRSCINARGSTKYKKFHEKNCRRGEQTPIAAIEGLLGKKKSTWIFENMQKTAILSTTCTVQKVTGKPYAYSTILSHPSYTKLPLRWGERSNDSYNNNNNYNNYYLIIIINN